MKHASSIIVGGSSLVVGALAFVGVFSYLAASFDYPGILDGNAAEVLPRLLHGGETMRAIWAVYAVLPLLLVPGAVAAWLACPASRGAMTLAIVLASIGALAMCLGLMRWPSIHWSLAQAWSASDPSAQASIAATFAGLNLYLGNFVGEFLGELCLGLFFLLAGAALRREAAFPRWLGWTGMGFALLLIVGAFRNVTGAVQPVADLNNALLPAWMIVMGGALVWRGRKREALAPSSG